VSGEDEEHLSGFPRYKWIFLLSISWLILGFVPIGLVFIGNKLFSVADSNMTAVAGTIGDAFGFANSFFSCAALLFVIWGLRLQQQEISGARKEANETAELQKTQALLMKETASLNAISQIYKHYSENYGTEDPTKILDAVAKGHRRWAIRESFSKIDDVFADDRVSQVHNEQSQLAELLMVTHCDSSYLREVAVRTSNLLVDKRAHKKFRQSLWHLYEILRDDPSELCREGSSTFSAFELRAKEVVKAWRELREKGE